MLKKIFIISLLLVGVAVNAATLNTSKSTYTSAEVVRVNVKGALSGRKDWVGIYPAGSSNSWGNVVAWNWVKNGQTHLTVSKKAMGKGNYEVRLFFRNSFNDEAKNTFAVGNKATLTTSKNTYKIDEVVSVNVKGALSGSKDWVGVYPAGSNNSWGNVLAWNWVKNGQTRLTTAKKAMGKGNYEVRLFFRNSFKNEAKKSFSVGNGGVTLTTSKNSYTVNENISVNITNQAPDNRNWIGIYKKSDNNAWGNVVRWAWTKGKTRIRLNGVGEGSFEARLFYKNSFKLETKVGFIVGEAKKYPRTSTLTKRLTDNTVRRPSVGHPSLDNVFGTKVKMVNVSNGASAKAPYPKIQAWNSDMSLIRISHRLYNAKTLEESPITKGLLGSDPYKKLCSDYSGDSRWSTKDPKKFYLVDSRFKLIEARIEGNTVKCDGVLFDFKKNNFDHAVIGPGEGNIDFNDQYIAFPVKKKGDNKVYIFLYDLKNKRKAWDKPKLYNQTAHWKDYKKNGRKLWKLSGELDWVSVSPSGKYIVINDSVAGMFRYDIKFQNKRRLEYIDKDGKISSQGGHGDIGFDTNGNEVFVQHISGTGVYSFNLDNPNEKGKVLLNSAFEGLFVSCRNIKRKGWCYISTYRKGFREVFALKLDGTPNRTVQRFFQTHHNYYGGVVSPDGTQVLFSNKWGGGKINAFIAETQ